MQLSDQYAKALYDVAEKHPGNAADHVRNLRASLAKRGHEKLLPRILTAYEHLHASAKRKARVAAITPEERRTRTLVELYKKLISA
jgi:F0F1-type ATP synthase delta subunit